MNKFHLAGIIPIETPKLDFEFPWTDNLLQIAPNYLSIENSVYECAVAGCETIWIIGHKNSTPVIRKKIGDWILDPTVASSMISRKQFDKLKQIPIFYVPIHPRDQEKRSNLAWSILYGYSRAFHICNMFSRWTRPDKFYVTFPWGICDLEQIKKFRLKFSSKISRFLKSPDNKSVKDGEMLGFTFDSEDYQWMKKGYLEAEKANYLEASETDTLMKQVSMRQMLEYVRTIDPVKSLTLPWYYNLSSWEQYCKFLGSNERLAVKRPDITYHEFNPIACDLTE